MACAALECTTYEIGDTIIIITMQSYAKKLLTFLLLVLLLVLHAHEDAASSQPKLWLLSQ